MNFNSRIFIAGHKGMLGSALNKKYLIKLGELLGNKLTHTVSKNYLKNIKT